jgi:hypothetical protein
VEIRLGRLDSATIGGSQPRFRRMYFNLVMNAADAMSGRNDGVIEVSDTVEGDAVVLRVRDNGSGMTEEKIRQLLADRETLDGELHSLGFVFVRQTVAELNGEISIDSTPGEGTNVTIRLPVLSREGASPGPASQPTQAPSFAAFAPASPPTIPAPAGNEQAKAEPDGSAAEMHSACGRLLYADYENSQADFPGGIFAISITDDDQIDFLAHRSYDRYWTMNHEDLAPMHFAATFRGRLEEDDLKRPLLTLKEPQSIREYFEFKELPENQRSAEAHLRMVHDEYIRIARKLIDTGFPPQTRMELTGLPKFFPAQGAFSDAEPFPLRLLADQALSTEDRQ